MITATETNLVQSLLPILQHEGIARVPGLSTDQVDAIWEHVRRCPRWAGHVKREGRRHEGQPISCWDMHDLITAPHFFEWAVPFSVLAEAYLDALPLLYSVNVFESTPSDWSPHPGIEVFHRDYDDVKFLALFLYLTDVQPGDGAHYFQCGTQDGAPMTRTIEVFGPRGTAFLADTRGFHRGGRPTTSPRRLAWARWGVSDPPASYVRDCLQPMSRECLGDRYPSDLVVQKSIRLVVA